MNAKYQILVVEDNPLNMELVTDLLEANGHAVWQARTAEEGLRLAQDLPDLVLMDLSLPGVDGLSATQMLRATPEIAHLPVVALTAHAMKGDEQTALNAGCDGYITKPIDTRSFLTRVAGFLATGNLRRTLAQLISKYEH